MLPLGPRNLWFLCLALASNAAMQNKLPFNIQTQLTESLLCTTDLTWILSIFHHLHLPRSLEISDFFCGSSKASLMKGMLRQQLLTDSSPVPLWHRLYWEMMVWPEITISIHLQNLGSLGIPIKLLWLRSSVPKKERLGDLLKLQKAKSATGMTAVSWTLASTSTWNLPYCSCRDSSRFISPCVPSVKPL